MKHKHNHTAAQTQTQQEAVVSQMNQAHGIPPGLDLDLTGREMILHFSGHFYARPKQDFISFNRK